ALSQLASAGLGGRGVPVLRTSARDGTGIAELVAALDDHRAALARSGDLAARRRAGMIAWGARAFARRHGEAGVERAGGEDAVRALIARAVDAGGGPLDVVDAWMP